MTSKHELTCILRSSSQACFTTKVYQMKNHYYDTVLIMLPMYLLFCECNTKNDNIKGSGPYVNDVPKHAQCLLNRSLAFSYIFEWHTKSIFRVNVYVRSFWCLWFLSIEGQKYCHAKSEFIVFFWRCIQRTYHPGIS